MSHIEVGDMHDEKPFPNTIDARTWTKNWLETIKLHPLVPFDEGTMICWFANAIMSGWDEANRRRDIADSSDLQPEK